MIREKLPDATIGIFIHATFPSSSVSVSSHVSHPGEVGM